MEFYVDTRSKKKQDLVKGIMPSIIKQLKLRDPREYVASFKEAGLGANQTINYILRAGSGTQFTYQCYTRSNNALNFCLGSLAT